MDRKKRLKKLLAVLTTLICLGSQATFAATIVTSAGDDSRVKEILGFDAGALGIVDNASASTAITTVEGTDKITAIRISRGTAGISAELPLFKARALH